MNRDHALALAAAYFDHGGLLADLTRRVACPTASDAGATPAQLGVYLHEHMVPALQHLGFDCRIVDNPVAGGPPMLIARRIEDPALPTVLSYGHGDVIDGQVGRWAPGLEPWTLTVDGEHWYGRGTADNKGQHSINLGGLGAAIAARGGRLGYNVKLLVEMGEELGSPGLDEACARHADELAADLFLASDGPRLAAARPTLFTGSRGAVNFTLTLCSRDKAYHSGNWGGVLVNPGVVLAHALASLVDRHGRLLVPGLLPPPLSPALRAVLTDLPVGGDVDDPALAERWGEPGLNAAEQLFGWNTLEVLALGAGNPQRPVNAIPPVAQAFCQLRFVVGTVWQDLEKCVRAHLVAHGYGEVEVAVHSGAPATRLEPDDPWVRWCCASLARSSGGGPAAAGDAPVFLPNLAGTLPNEVFAGRLGLPTLWVPHSYPACNQHAPDEHLLAPLARQGLQLMAGLYWDL
ncbi:MAG: hypothetical protein RLZZ584_3107, partial [Pseudomonadota bacterium]